MTGSYDLSDREASKTDFGNGDWERKLAKAKADLTRFAVAIAPLFKVIGAILAVMILTLAKTMKKMDKKRR